MQKSKWFLLVCILAALLMVSVSMLTACSRQSTPAAPAAPAAPAPAASAPAAPAAPQPAASSPGAPAPAASGPSEIVIGAINSMTGVEALVGKEPQWAYTKAVNDINAKGGVFVKELNKKLPMKLIWVDDESDYSKTAAATEKLIKENKVDFILGSVDSPLNIAGGAVAEKYKKLYVCTTLFKEMFSEQKFTWVADSFFSAGKLMQSSVQGLEVIAKDQRPQNFCVLVEDNPDGQGFGGGAKGILEGAGYKLALMEPFTPGTKDFSASILRMKGANVDGLITLISPTDAITLVRQLKENKFAPKYVWGARGFWPIDFGQTLGADADYMVSDGHWAEALGAPGSKELGDAFRAEFGATKYSVTIGNFYSLIQGLAQAIETAGSIDPQKVRDVYYSGSFVARATTQGDVPYINGMGEVSPVALQWWKGQRMPVVPTDTKIWTLKLMPAWDKR
jgi:branched-chain amino acid transport system substrate-binding protein